jgi:uncharacterized membrane-anchored protein
LYVSDDLNYSLVGVRGFSKPGDFNMRVILLVNGHPVNDNVYSQAQVGSEFGIDPAMFERVEIIRRPASSLYGTGAFAERWRAIALRRAGDCAYLTKPVYAADLLAAIERAIGSPSCAAPFLADLPSRLAAIKAALERLAAEAHLEAADAAWRQLAVEATHVIDVLRRQAAAVEEPYPCAS